MQTFCTSASGAHSDSPTRRPPIPSSHGRSHGLWVLTLCLLLAASALHAPATHGQSAPTALRATDLLQVREIRDVTLSPSGRNVAYTVRGVVSENGPPQDRTRLYVTPSQGRGSPQLLTRSRHDARHPAWHPDGGQLAYVRPVDGTPQVFVLSLSGGEAYQLTDAPHGATHPQWSPSGDRLLFASSVPESEIRRRSGQRPPAERPGRSPQDTIRRVPPDTILVLRHTRTLDPVDTLAMGPDGRLAPAPDTTRRLRTPGDASVPDSLRQLPVDRLRSLPPDSLRTMFERLRMLPDTTLVPVPPDTAATPDGDLLQTRRWLDQNRPNREAQVFSRLDPGGQDGLHPTSTYRHYFLVDVPNGIASGTPPRPPARPVTKGYRSYQGATWMPGGTQIVVSAPPSTTDVPDRLQDRNLYVVDLRPYRLQQVLDIEGYVLTNPHVTADGTTLAFQAQNRATRSYAQAQIGLFELDGRSNPQLITENFDHDVSSLRWSPDGWYLYATAPTRGGRPLYRFAPFARGDTATVRGQPSLADEFATSRDTFALDSSMVRTARYTQVLNDSRSVQALDVTDSKAVYAVAGPETPSALHTNTISFNNERPLARPNADWMTNRSLAPSEWIEARHEDVSVQGRLTPPPNRRDSLRYPLVVVPRGGPAPLDASSPIPAWIERHYLAGHGYAVLEVWPRGSAGFGETFRQRNYQDWGPGPAGDVISVADSVAARSWIDTTRQALAGRSYGGYLTTWLLGHTDRFQAAVAQSGVYDLDTFFGDGDAWPLIPEQFGGFPWEPAATPPPDLFIQPPADPFLSVGLLPALDTTMVPRTALRRNAPMTSAHRIETPLLLTHGGADQRTGTGQAEMLFRRLQILDRPVEYVRYPQAGHTFWRSARPAQRLDRLVRVREFLERFVPSGGRLPTGETAAP